MRLFRRGASLQQQAQKLDLAVNCLIELNKTNTTSQAAPYLNLLFTCNAGLVGYTKLEPLTHGRCRVWLDEQKNVNFNKVS